MLKIYNFIIPMSFIGLWVTSMFSKDLEIYFGFILIFTFGILHGSNDILLINSLSNTKRRNPFISVLITYLIVILIAVITFYFFPLLALILFIIFSAFHFGQQHWEHKELEISLLFRNFFYFIYGVLILELLFIFNSEEVIVVIDSITQYKIDNEIIEQTLIISASIFALLIIIISYISKNFRKQLFIEIFYLIVFAIIFKVSTLIWGFTIYFILWHSIPSLFEQISFIYGDFNRINLLKYFKTALPYWLISITGIVIVYFVFRDEKIFYAIFFSFIAAVTFPHTIVINRLFTNKKTQPNK